MLPDMVMAQNYKFNMTTIDHHRKNNAILYIIFNIVDRVYRFGSRRAVAQCEPPVKQSGTDYRNLNFIILMDW